jgi:hypothetical protein
MRCLYSPIILLFCFPVLANSTLIPLRNANFEAEAKPQRERGEFTPGWSAIQHAGIQAYEFSIDQNEKYEGKQSLRIHRHKPQVYGIAMQRLDASVYVGKRVKFSGYIKLKEVEQTAGLALICFTNNNNALSYDNVKAQRTGSTEWLKVETEAVLVPSACTILEVSVGMKQGGTIWADDLRLEVLD